MAHQRVVSRTRPTLFIEVKLADKTAHGLYVRNDEIRSDVEVWLHKNFRQLQVGQRLDTRSLGCHIFVQSVAITEQSHSHRDDTFHVLADHKLDIAVYALASGEDDDRDDAAKDDAPTDDSGHPWPQFMTMALPHKSLDGAWESLVYPDAIPELVLRILTRMTKISCVPSLDPALICWHNLILLHGPPGTGKSTLAKAVAQKLSIRLAHIYSTVKFMEVPTRALFSQWFGKTGKLVGQLFDTIWNISLDESLLLVVVIDEVESIAASRERAAQSREVGDAVRGTNELLQGLDRIRKRPNVVFICTSNFKDNLDPAFVDRCAVDELISTPTVDCAYEIFRSRINELIRVGLISYDASEIQNLFLDGDMTMEGCGSPNDTQYIPNAAWAKVFLLEHRSTAPSRLREIAQMAEGLSGRRLCQLPMLALTKYTVDEPTLLTDLLEVLKRVVAQANGSNLMDEAPPNEAASSESDCDDVETQVAITDSTGSSTGTEV